MYVTESSSPIAEQARRKAAEARQVFEMIRQDKNLSPEGRQESLAREWWHRVKEIRALEATELASKRDRRESLHRELFGSSGYLSGSDIISQRDAADRASRLQSEEEAERLITAARRNGDVTLLKSIAQHAFEQTWTGALEHWADGDDAVEERVNELYRLTGSGTITADAAALLAHGMTFSLEKPGEIDGMSTTALDTLVGESTSAWGESPIAATSNGRSDRARDYSTALNSPDLADVLQGSAGAPE